MKAIFTLLLATSISFIGISQITFYDFTPDFTLQVNEDPNGYDTTKYFNIDINSDLIDDINFELKYFYSFNTPSSNQGYNLKVGSENEPYKFGSVGYFACAVGGLSSGDEIGGDMDWNFGNSFNLMRRDPENFVFCNEFEDFKYLPFLVSINGEPHYGWMLLEVFVHWNGNYSKLTIKEYAYNTLPYYGLIAGDTETSILPTSYDEQIGNEDFEIYPNPAKDMINIKNIKQFDQIILSDIYGRTVIIRECKYNQEAIDCSSLRKGIYLLSLTNKEGIITKQIIID